MRFCDALDIANGNLNSPITQAANPWIWHRGLGVAGHVLRWLYVRFDSDSHAGHKTVPWHLVFFLLQQVQLQKFGS